MLTSGLPVIKVSKSLADKKFKKALGICVRRPNILKFKNG